MLSFQKTALLLLIQFTVIVAQAQETGAELVAKATTLYNNKDYAGAAPLYEKAAALNNNAEAYFKAGWCYNETTRFAPAITNLKKAIEARANYASAYLELGYAYKKTAQYDDALTSLQKAIKLKAQYPAAYKQMGDVYEKQEKKAEAIAAYKKCVEQDVMNTEASYEIGYLYNGQAQYDSAIVWLNKSNAIKPTTSIYNELGFALYKQQKNEAALEAYKKAAELTPTNGTAYKGMGDIYRRNYKPAKTTEAIACYKKAVENNPKSGGSYFGLGWCYNEKQQYDDAIPVLQKAIDREAGLAAAYSELGYALYMKSRNSEALSIMKQGIVVDPRSTFCHYYSGLVYIAMKDKPNATVMYNTLKPLDNALAEKLLVKINAL